MVLTLPKIRRFIVLTSILLVVFVSGWYSHERGLVLPTKDQPRIKIDRTIPASKNVDFALFWEVWDRIERSYYDKSKIDYRKMVYGAIKGMVSSLDDPYTVFLPPEEQKRTQEDLEGNFEGVGIQIGFKGTQLAVIAPLQGSPAEKAGVKAGDYIVGIKDKAKNVQKGTVGISLFDAVDLIRGQAGTKVTLVLTRKDAEAPIEAEMTREKIDVPSVVLTFEGKDKKIAYLKLMKFGDQTNVEWDKAVEKIRSTGARGMVLDVRNNPGGYLNGAIYIASEFLPRGVVVVQQDGKGNKTEMTVTGRARLPNLPVVMLVNGGSASASEILAGALRDNDRAKIYGETTFGKGTVQEAQDIDAGSGLHVTTAKWLTPKGTWVNDGGLKPDTEVKDNPETAEVDEQLQEALKALD
ncbi:MAG: S41 family peptidase [bacterium]|nr:S41 family peptidase [bacterium]